MQTTTQQKATWAKLSDGSWGICIPEGMDAREGRQIDVHKRYGGISTEYIGEHVKTTYYGQLFRVGKQPENKWTFDEVSDYIADMDLEYKYHTNRDIWNAVRILNAGGQL